jgi:hypothetical protein
MSETDSAVLHKIYVLVRAAVVAWFVLLGLGIVGGIAMLVAVNDAATTSSREFSPSPVTRSTSPSICSQYVPPC